MKLSICFHRVKRKKNKLTHSFHCGLSQREAKVHYVFKEKHVMISRFYIQKLTVTKKNLKRAFIVAIFSCFFKF